MSLSLPPLKEAVKKLLITDNIEVMTSISLSCNRSWDDLLSALKQCPTITIVDDEGHSLGYLSAGQIAEFIYHHFNQLSEYYHAVLKTSDSSVTVIDENGIVCSWTEGAERIFSVNNQDIIGKPITDFFEYEKLEILQSLNEGKSITGHYHQPRSDLFVLINSNPVYLNGHIIGAVVSETDVTHQVALNEKLFHMSNEMHRLEQEMAKYKNTHDAFHTIKGKSTAIKNTIALAKKVCTVKSTVLILGESGVGKEVFAKAIHEASEGPGAPFISINCGAIPSSLFESELFGYERGSFSGADPKGKKGKIELARGGTLFLDEIGELPLDMQVKLLRVLQERKYYRVGGEKEIDINFRILTATNRDLPQLMKEGKFREDLYYRLNVVSIPIPPLRERKEDLIELVHHFIYNFSISYNRPIHQLAPEVIHELLQYDWPGNIRELRNVAERLVVFATDGVIRKEYLPFTPNHSDQSSNVGFLIEEKSIENEEPILPLQVELEKHERCIIEKALRLTAGNKVECAKQLGITRATLYNRMKRLGLH